MARCANCGLELLGSMKKCPKCGYDMSTGQIDNNYLKNIDKSRGEAGVSKNNDKTLYCDGRFSDNRNAGDRCEIRIVNDEVLKVCNFKRNGFGRTVTKRAFGLVGTLIYDSVHEDDRVGNTFRGFSDQTEDPGQKPEQDGVDILRLVRDRTGHIVCCHKYGRKQKSAGKDGDYRIISEQP